MSEDVHVELADQDGERNKHKCPEVANRRFVAEELGALVIVGRNLCAPGKVGDLAYRPPKECQDKPDAQMSDCHPACGRDKKVIERQERENRSSDHP